MARAKLVWCRGPVGREERLTGMDNDSQACWACGRHPVVFGKPAKLHEVYDRYGKLVLCGRCRKEHEERL